MSAMPCQIVDLNCYHNEHNISQHDTTAIARVSLAACYASAMPIVHHIPFCPPHHTLFICKSLCYPLTQSSITLHFHCPIMKYPLSSNFPIFLATRSGIFLYIHTHTNAHTVHLICISACVIFTFGHYPASQRFFLVLSVCLFFLSNTLKSFMPF